MSLAFGVSEEDVATVLALSFGMRQLDDDTIADYFDHIDGDEVEKAALYGNSMDEQTEYAYNDIARQLLTSLRRSVFPMVRNRWIPCGYNLFMHCLPARDFCAPWIWKWPSICLIHQRRRRRVRLAHLRLNVMERSCVWNEQSAQAGSANGATLLCRVAHLKLGAQG